MGKCAAVKLYPGHASLIFYNFYIVHSDAFAQKSRAKSLAYSFFCSPSGRKALCLLLEVLG